MSVSAQVAPARTLETLDRAFELARSQSWSELRTAWAPGLVLTWLAIALYYAERVEGVRALRPVFALAFTLAWCLRGVVLGRWAGRRVASELATYSVVKPEAPTQTLARTALWLGADLWLWLWPLVFALHLDPWLVPAFLPMLALRGALAPSWLAAADASRADSGFATLRHAISEAEGQRHKGMVVELLCLVGALGLTFNLGAIAVLLVSLGQDAFGLDLAFARAFLSPRNHFALLALFGFALSLLEPLRAAFSAVLYLDAQLLRGGVAVRTLVERATAPRGRGSALSVLLCLMLWAPVRGEAQAPATEPLLETTPIASEPEPQAEPCEPDCERARARDQALRERVQAILREPVFAEFPDERWEVDDLGKGGLEAWFQRFWRWLFESEDADEPLRPDALPRLDLPGPWFFAALAAGLALFVLLRLALARPRLPQDVSVEPGAPEDPFQRSPESHFADALALAARDPRAALRALYLATLIGLARRNLVELSPERTNGQYLRQLPRGDDQRLFAQLTRTFDAVQYGALTPTRDDFERCRQLAERLVQGAHSA